MTWTHPWILFAFLPLCAFLALLQIIWRKRIQQQQASIGATQPALNNSVKLIAVHIRVSITWLAMVLLIIASAGPRWGSGDVTRNAVGSYLVFAIDCSRSMLAEDLYPNRMKQAHFKALDFMKANPEHKVALLPFARIATLRTPFTGDHVAVSEMIKDCTPDLFPAEYGFQGTAIGKTVLESCTLLQNHRGSSLAVVIFSDGSDKDEEAIQQAIAEAKKHGIRIYCVFLGDTEREVSLMIDGKEQKMTASRSTLDALALGSGGLSVNATNDNTDIIALSDHILKNINQEDWAEQQRLVAMERYQWFLIPAILLFILSLLLPSRRAIVHVA